MNDFARTTDHRQIAFGAHLNDRPPARVDLNGGHALLLIVDPQSQRPDGRLALQALSRVNINTMVQRSALRIQSIAPQKLADLPIQIRLFGRALFQEPVTLDSARSPG